LDLHYVEVGVCGLSCRLCPMHHTAAESRCAGCKSPARIAIGCPFITCAVKKRGIEFCWQCPEAEICKKWIQHRQTGQTWDSFKCYQKLEDDIAFIQKHGIEEFENQQIIRENLLKELLADFNDGRSKTYYSIAATVMEINELQENIKQAKSQSKKADIKQKVKLMHSLMDSTAKRKGYVLKLRK
jgi:hypothetical protein